jgi:DNA-binding transcriptional regulator YiaG
MKASEFRAARQSLGLSVNQLAEILDTNPVTVRRWEMDDDKNTARDPNPIACQVLRWLKDGRLRL